uniref:Uncharacterized protein n=1 Tax=Rhizophora mucronata TaxID=61149 RepID=A0A2P2PI73_RHIMU
MYLVVLCNEMHIIMVRSHKTECGVGVYKTTCFTSSSVLCLDFIA